MSKPSKRLIFDYLPSGRNRGDRGDRRRAAAATADLQEELWKLFRRPDGIFPNVGSAAGRSLADKEDEERAARLCAPRAAFLTSASALRLLPPAEDPLQDAHAPVKEQP